MAKPDCDDGWIRLAHELQAAIMTADFKKFEGVILSEVFGQIYGPSRQRSALIRPGVIANQGGWDRGNLSRATASLVADGVLEKGDQRGEYRFVKDYTTWTKGGRPRFSPRELVWIAQAAQRAIAFFNVVYRDNNASDNVVQRDNNVVQRDNNVVYRDNTNVVYRDNKMLSIETTSHCKEKEKRAELRLDARTNVVYRDNNAVETPFSDDYGAAVALIRAASDRTPQLEDVASKLDEMKRMDIEGRFDAIASDGWRWQFAVRRFLSEAGAKVRAEASRNVKRQALWIRSVAVDATEAEFKAEQASLQSKPETANGRPKTRRELDADERRKEIAESFAKKHAAMQRDRDGESRSVESEARSSAPNARQTHQDAFCGDSTVPMTQSTTPPLGTAQRVTRNGSPFFKGGA